MGIKSGPGKWDPPSASHMINQPGLAVEMIHPKLNVITLLVIKHVVVITAMLSDQTLSIHPNTTTPGIPTAHPLCRIPDPCNHAILR